jgi:hypothetical protein
VAVRARRSGRGRVFIDAGGRLGGLEGNHVAGAHAVWAARHGNVRRTSGPMASGVRCGQQGTATCGGPAAQWLAAVGTPASGLQPPGTVQAPTDVTHSSSPARRMDRWVVRCLGVHARRAYGELAWCACDVARECALASRGEKQFADAVFKIGFSLDF